MSNNPQKPQIILYSRHEIKVENGKTYCFITDMANIEHKISNKRQLLWDLFTTAKPAEPFMLIYETYNNIDYVADAKSLVNDLLKLAIQDLGMKMADVATEDRNRSIALSYATNLCVGQIIPSHEIYDWATKNYRFIKGARSVDPNNVEPILKEREES